MDRILKEIREERHRQNVKHGADRDQHPFVWIPVLGKEYGEVCKAAIEHYVGHRVTLDDYRDGLIQVAATAVAMIENLDSNADRAGVGAENHVAIPTVEEGAILEELRSLSGG